MTAISTDPPRARPEGPSRASRSLSVPAEVRLTVDADGFARLCAANRDVRLERDADGGLVVMSPASPEGSGRELQAGFQLEAWSRGAKLGEAFGATAGFTPPDGSVRAGRLVGPKRSLGGGRPPRAPEVRPRGPGLRRRGPLAVRLPRRRPRQDGRGLPPRPCRPGWNGCWRSTT